MRNPHGPSTRAVPTGNRVRCVSGLPPYLRLVPDAGVAVALLTNGGRATALAAELVGRVLSELTPVTLPALPEPPADPPRIDAAAYAKRVEASGPSAFVEAIVYRQDEVPPGVLRGVRRTKGGAAIVGELPLAPTKGFAAPILRSVG